MISPTTSGRPLSYGPLVSDRDGAAERRDQDDEGLISRFWKAPTSVDPSPAPPSSDREAEKD